MNMMRALAYDRYGPPENVLRLDQLPRPVPRSGEVLVRVCAAAVNAWDWDRLVGRPLGRITDPLRPPHKILGSDIAGVVESLGPGVSELAVGDAVFGDLTQCGWGGFADYVCAPVLALARKPKQMSFCDAAALPQAGLLAREAMKSRPALRDGDSVLIVGAGGGAGIFALQMAKSTGAAITGVDKGSKGPSVLAAGASDFVDYQKTDFSRTDRQYDFIIDMVGSQSVFGYRRALKPGGSLVLVGGSLGRILQVVVLGPSVGKAKGQSMGLAIYQPTIDGLEQLCEKVASGVITPVIDSVFPLERGAEALRRIGDGNHVGKVIIDLTA